MRPGKSRHLPSCPSTFLTFGHHAACLCFSYWFVSGGRWRALTLKRPTPFGQPPAASVGAPEGRPWPVASRGTAEWGAPRNSGGTIRRRPRPPSCADRPYIASTDLPTSVSVPGCGSLGDGYFSYAGDEDSILPKLPLDGIYVLRISVEVSGLEGGMVISSYKPSLMSCGSSAHLILTWTSAQSATAPKPRSALMFEVQHACLTLGVAQWFTSASMIPRRAGTCY
jgi:hypothetical protein